LASFYAHDYRIEYKHTPTPKLKHIHRAGMTALDRLRYLATNGVRDGTLLDIGAGGGEFVYLARRAGFDARGIEPNVGYSTFAREQYGVELATGHLSDVEGQYDVASMFHVLEHLPDPLSVFGKLWSIVKPGGTLLIEVPDIETPAVSPRNIFFKAHIFYFSAATLTAFASPYFDAIVATNETNLRMLLKRREQQSDCRLPPPSDVNHTLARLRAKGWLEYLTRGGGLTKVFSTLTQRANEKRFATGSPKSILDQLSK
jgi:2-polyprenyl-3-methyl-5-hydroxy-6-metoxy-1,4-benzoquinol methylase